MNAAALVAEATPDEEIALARVEMTSGQGPEAVRRLQALIDRLDFEPMLYYWLAAAQGAAGNLQAQRDTLKDAQTYHALQLIRDAGGDLERFQRDPAYAAQVGAHFYQAKLMGPAAVAYGQAAMGPGASAQVIVSWGLALQHQGRMEEAMIAFSAAAETHPAAWVHQFLLYACFFTVGGVTRHAQEVRRWAELYAQPYDPAACVFGNAPLAGRRLRIGYVAPSFVGTQVRQFLMPVLENHDAAAVEVLLYCADAAAEPALPAAAIRGIGKLDDAAAADLIRADRLDVLVDLWGHTAGGRLGVFARKPAPVQVCWINYVQSTGLEAMDYVIHADCMDVPGTDSLFTEKPWILGPVMAPFRPDGVRRSTPTPALAKGHMTFASFNHPARLNDQTVAAWAAILKARAGARLTLKYGYFIDPVLQNATCSRFAAHGLDPARIDFQGHSAGADYFAAFAEVDLALDPSPCPGGTTTSDSLAHGVPVLTLRGPDFYSRVGVLCVEPQGLNELVAEDWDDYVARAIALTEDATALDALRRRVFDGFDAWPSRDEAGFTRGLEAAFTEMYRRWEADHG
jgi:predicted O-linked N-acetylglucosamine transferase (SPINDLY family)